ncbi:hypothetical protein LS68_000035 [Helicobacter sp. MIT 05-5293]|uniref:hypothetical protein n=1 Tax=Helicobacter sp. MIT 05-5293 TaxID=1548149 RepID=UPI00051DB1E9|nr:hypothetical protein [Helicobacter sp. MIT 05-5293]TLD81471.1 hypothetical protein LS68_000035 [Helicobacter sp. MIT 05-5293]
MKTSKLIILSAGILFLFSVVESRADSEWEKINRICQQSKTNVSEQNLGQNEVFVICTPLLDKNESLSKTQIRAQLYAKSQLLSYLKTSDSKLEGIKISAFQSKISDDQNQMLSILPKENLVKLYAISEESKPHSQTNFAQETISTKEALNALQTMAQSLETRLKNNENLADLETLSQIYFQLGDTQSYNATKERIIAKKFE